MANLLCCVVLVQPPGRRLTNLLTKEKGIPRQLVIISFQNSTQPLYKPSLFVSSHHSSKSSTNMNRMLALRSLSRSLLQSSSSRAYHSSSAIIGHSGSTTLADQPARHFLLGISRINRSFSSSAAPTEEKEDKLASSDEAKQMVSSYWGVSQRSVTKEDGTAWPWNCFMPWDTYNADLSVDLSKHHVPKNFLDKFAYHTVKTLRIPTDIFFQRRYGCRAMMLETVAAVPGMVGGMLLHLRSLRKFQHSGGWIKALLEEAENERMHLMTMVELVKPNWYERLLVLAVQGGFFNVFFVMYILSPKLAHRVVGYLEEEAVHSYTEFLKDIESGAIENVPAPAIAIDYWRLPKDATLRDVVIVIRADEAHHRDVNHFASDIHFQGKELREAPAPTGHH